MVPWLPRRLVLLLPLQYDSPRFSLAVATKSFDSACAANRAGGYQYHVVELSTLKLHSHGFRTDALSLS